MSPRKTAVDGDVNQDDLDTVFRPTKRRAAGASMSSREATIDYGVDEDDLDLRSDSDDSGTVTFSSLITKSPVVQHHSLALIMDAFLDGSTLVFTFEHKFAVWWKIEELQKEKWLVGDFLNRHREKAAGLLTKRQIRGYIPRDTFPDNTEIQKIEDVGMYAGEVYVKVVPRVFLKASDVEQSEYLKYLALEYFKTEDLKTVFKKKPEYALRR